MLGLFQYGIRIIPFIIEFGITTDGEIKLRAGLPGKVATDL